MKVTPGWAAELVGEKIDLDDLRALLAPPFVPWVEDYKTEQGVALLLRSPDWGQLSDATAVRHDATRMVERLNGAAALLHTDAVPVSLGQIRKFGMDGNPEPIVVSASGHAQGTSRARGRGSVTTGNSGPRRETLMQKWFREADADDSRADLLAYVSRANNWYDLFKAAECARRLSGGKNGLKAILGTDFGEWDRIWQTANFYRHAPDPVKSRLPQPPAEFDVGREFMLRAITRVFKS